METHEIKSLMEFYKSVESMILEAYSKANKNTPKCSFQSPEIDKLASALSLAQGAYLPLVFNRTNPMTLTEYVDIDAIFSATRKSLTDNGLAVIQLPVTDTEGTIVYTKLVHNSGQYTECYSRVTCISGEMKVFSSVLNETKKQALLAILGIAPRNSREDDDCEAETHIARTEKDKGTSIRHNYGTVPEDIYTPINKQQLEELDYALSGDDMKDVYKSILKQMRVNNLSEVPQEQYRKVLDQIYKIKEARKGLK